MIQHQVVCINASGVTVLRNEVTPVINLELIEAEAKPMASKDVTTTLAWVS